MKCPHCPYRDKECKMHVGQCCIGSLGNHPWCGQCVDRFKCEQISGLLIVEEETMTDDDASMEETLRAYDEVTNEVHFKDILIVEWEEDFNKNHKE